MFQHFKLVFNVCLVCIVHHPWGSWIVSAPNPFVNFSLRLRVYEWNLSFALQITFLWIPPVSFSHIEIEKVRIMGSSSFRLVACSIGPPNFASAVCFGHLKERLQTPIITPKCIPKRNKKQRYWRKCRTIMLLNFQNFQIQKITNLPPQMVLKWFFLHFLSYPLSMGPFSLKPTLHFPITYSFRSNV